MIGSASSDVVLGRAEVEQRARSPSAGPRPGQARPASSKCTALQRGVAGVAVLVATRALDVVRDAGKDFHPRARTGATTSKRLVATAGLTTTTPAMSAAGRRHAGQSAPPSTARPRPPVVLVDQLCQRPSSNRRYQSAQVRVFGSPLVMRARAGTRHLGNVPVLGRRLAPRRSRGGLAGGVAQQHARTTPPVISGAGGGEAGVAKGESSWPWILHCRPILGLGYGSRARS